MKEHLRTHWSDLDLEQYHDGGLSAQRRATLMADLFADRTLRDRLGRIASVDELGRQALLGDVPSDVGAPTLGPTARRAILATAAACALVVTGVATRTMWMRSPQPTIAEVTSTPVSPRTYSQERLTLTISVSPEFRFASRRDIDPLPASALSPQEQAIQSAISRGDAEGALRLLAKSDARDRSAEWSQLGRMMQSAQRARAAILFLPINKQIKIVRAWSDEPSLRPVVFERLEELLDDPASAPAARELRAELALNPQLSSWVQSYASAR